jgi:hypothetical protein
MPLSFDRRGFMVVTGAGVLATSLAESTAAISQQATPGANKVNAALAAVKACVFDTFGTVVDWRSSVIAEATKWGKARGLNIDWVEFTDRWRLGYRPAMDKVHHDFNKTVLDDLEQSPP